MPLTSEALLWIVIQIPLIFFLLRFFTVRAQVSEADDFGMLNIFMTMSIILIGQLFLIGAMQKVDFIGLLLVIAGYYIGVWVASFAFKTKENFRTALPSVIQGVIKADNAHYFVIGISIILVLVFGSFFSIKQILAGSPDDRLVIADSNRIIDIVRSGALGLYLPLLFCFWLVLKERYLWLTFLPYAVIKLMTGAKGAFFGIIFTFMLVRGVVLGKKSFIEEMKLGLPFALLGLAGAVGVVLFYGKGLSGAVHEIVTRLFLSGDVYLYSYVIGDYRELYGHYNPVGYILHPFLKMVGLSGYDDPLGNKLMEQIRDDARFGPNAHISMVFLTLTYGNAMLSSLCTFFVGFIAVALKYGAFKILQSQRLYPFMKLGLFFALFPSALLFIDMGVMQQRMITVVLVLIIIGGLFEAIMSKPSKKLKTNDLNRTTAT